MASGFSELFKALLKKHGYQGWWPLQEVGYHPGDYRFPRNDRERFEICVGAILTQNTTWKNAEKAVSRLYEMDILSPSKIIRNEKKVAEAIRCAGYYNQKTRKLKEFSKYFLLQKNVPAREELLSIWGIGKETADTILNYAYFQEVFVVDAYSRRVFKREGLIDGDEEYDEIREKVEKEVRGVENLQEFHALLVAEGKKLRST